jgi:hypothetical protein
MLNQGLRGSFSMSQHEPRALRLMVALEADALVANFGGEAYAVACERAEEASSEMLAADWREVALTIARRDQRVVRPSDWFGSLAILIAQSNRGRPAERGTPRK